MEYQYQRTAIVSYPGKIKEILVRQLQLLLRYWEFLFFHKQHRPNCLEVRPD